MKHTHVASGVCATCARYVEYTGSSEQDAKQMLINGHGKWHIFQGTITTRTCTSEEARKIKRMAA